ncbi:putative effector protein [Blumeria hordei DH14]|uniref:Putative effector protein n=1 Tax=Blumeria graminis f. sp. hordei (strain DH14) TaxID=546991 RepID=N1JRG4_BLUG1|nr:putative effector protein [Blumeria hordei DH14]
MKLSSLLLNGELIEGKKTAFGQEALAWYQGHLHLFKRNGKRNAWMPVTTIGHENNNGWLITNFINATFPEIFNDWKDYYEYNKKYEDALKGISRREERRLQQNAKKYKRAINTVLKELIPWKLATSLASGITMAM